MSKTNDTWVESDATIGSRKRVTVSKREDENGRGREERMWLEALLHELWGWETGGGRSSSNWVRACERTSTSQGQEGVAVAGRLFLCVVRSKAKRFGGKGARIESECWEMGWVGEVKASEKGRQDKGKTPHGGKEWGHRQEHREGKVDSVEMSLRDRTDNHAMLGKKGKHIIYKTFGQRRW